MSVPRPPRRELRASRERGQAMLLTVLLLAVGVSAVVYNFVTPAKQAIERDKITTAALAQARAALIGYAVGIRLDVAATPRVGDLPCPDMSAPGSATEGTAGTSCSNGGGTTLGRLPWKTLGLPDLRDGSGERLWYAVSANFKNNPAVGTLNSDSRGTITVRDRNGNVVNDGTDVGAYTRSGAVAVILAPGGVLTRLGAGAAQDRSSAAAQTNPVNYLDLANVGGNEDNSNFVDGNANGFINGPVLDASGNTIVNDRLITIRYDDIVPLMERRVAGEALKCLNAYASANNGHYPWAAPVASGAYADQMNNYFGRIPDAPLSATRYGTLGTYDPTTLGWIDNACVAQAGYCMGKSWPAAPSCNFTSGTWWTQWKEQAFFGVASGYNPNQIAIASMDLFAGTVTLAPPPIPAPACGPCLTVNPPSVAADKQLVVMVAGKQLSGVNGTPPRINTDATYYLEDDNVTPPADLYSKKPRTTTFNDTVLYK
jgi:hypothetical protein